MPIRRSSICLEMEIISTIGSGYKTKPSIIKKLRINSVIFERYISNLVKKGIVEQRESRYFELTEKGLTLLIKIKKMYEISHSINFLEQEVRRYLEMRNSEELEVPNRPTQ